MNRPAVLIPVKLIGAKSRLSSVLDASQRKEFTKLLLSDVVGALEGAGLLDSAYVVSPDPEVLALAALKGACPVKETMGAGVNSAVRKGMEAAAGAGDYLVIPSDLPLLRASELRGLLTLKGSGMDVAIAPSRAFDGTNALLFSAGSPLRLSYDNNSFWNHLASASREGLKLGVSSTPGIMFDVDSPRDLRALAESRAGSRPAVFAREALG